MMSNPKPWLADPRSTIEIIKKFDFRIQKKFGQNFLIDEHVLNKIISAADVGEDDLVIEIGPGIGTLTQYLAYNAREVIAVEIDKNLLPVHEETLAGYDNITVINEDILKLDINRLLEERGEKRPVKIVANLPYYITTPIIMGLFEKHIPLESITVMVQSEVADRMKSGPGSKDYGALSLAVQYYADVYLAANVPPNCFIPRPNVGSAVVRLTLKKEKPEVADEALLFRLIRCAFEQRRKTFINSLKNTSRLPLTREQWEELFAQCGFDANIRGEALSLEDFVRLANACKEKIG